MKKYLFVLLLVSAALHAGNKLIITEKPSVYATMQCIGVQWNVSGDENGNASCSMEFREKGTDK
ncbi:MAG: hypothetical protein WCI43_03510 [Candidatus Firestonebacteria bacterium]